MKDPLPRFLDRINKVDGCWLWTGTVNSSGYGHFSVEGRKVYTHRWAYEHSVGSIPDGMQIDHLCRVPTCVNPEHLEPVTQGENMLRGVAPAARAVRTNTCIRGHEFTPENTYHRRDRVGRQCRACNAIRRAARKARLGVAA